MVTRASKKNSSEGGVFDLGALGLGDSFVTAEMYESADVSDFIPTGMPALDAALAGGLPMGRISEVFSPNNVGKTTFVIQVTRMANELGVPVFWFDTEGTNNRDHLKEMGVNMGMTVLYQPKKDDLDLLAIESIGEAMDMAMTKLSEKGMSGLFIVDSVGAALDKTLMSKGYDSLQPGTQAKAWTRVISKIQPLATKTRSGVIMINQIRDEIGGMGMKTVETPGGKALKHSYSFRIKLDRTGTKTLSGEEFGHMTQFRLVKSKLSQPRVKVKNVWLFGKYGFHESINLLLDAREHKLIGEASGGSKGKYYKIPDPETGEVIELYVNKLPKLIESGEISQYRPLFARLEDQLSAIYFPDGHPALKNKNFPLSNSSLFKDIKVPEKLEEVPEVVEEEEKEHIAEEAE